MLKHGHVSTAFVKTSIIHNLKTETVTPVAKIIIDRLQLSQRFQTF